jgi:hypothetical protein
MHTASARTPLLLILSSAVVAWALFMVGIYTDLFVEQVYNDAGEWIGRSPAITTSKYLFFAATAVFAAAAVIAQRMSIAQRVSAGIHDRPSRSGHRFATLSIIVGLAVAAIIGISVFLEGFSGNRQDGQTLLERSLDTYVPIVLFTGLVVVVLLAAFVFRSDTLPKSSDRVPDDAVDHEEVAGSGSQRDLGAAYAIPIVATAVALIFGLVVYDATGTSLDVWIWVIIQLVIGSGIVVGTIYGERAVAQGPTSQSSRARVTRSARGLNFVLSIVFGAIVTGMAFGYGGSAIDELRSSPSFTLDFTTYSGAPLNEAEVSVNGWDLKPGSAVHVALDDPSMSLLSDTIVDDYFYESRPLPGNLEPGDYLITAQATSADGRVITRELAFTVNDAYEVSWAFDDVTKMSREMQEDTVIITPSGSWLIRSLAPALVLLLIALSGIYFSLAERNRPARLKA